MIEKKIMKYASLRDKVGIINCFLEIEVLEERIKECVFEALSTFHKETSLVDLGLRQEMQNFLNRNKAAEYLSVSTTTIDNNVRLGKLPKYKLGRCSRFKISDLDELLVNHKKL